jgi:hypothetical protein
MLYKAIPVFLLTAAAVGAQDGIVLFRDTIQPVLEKNCLPCHNPKVKQGTYPVHEVGGVVQLELPD